MIIITMNIPVLLFMKKIVMANSMLCTTKRLNLAYALELCYETLKCNKTDT